MNVHMLNMILGGIAYLMTVYIMTKIMRKKIKNTREDDEDGGVNINALPEIDLPPGVTLPNGSSPSNKKEAPELTEASS